MPETTLSEAAEANVASIRRGRAEPDLTLMYSGLTGTLTAILGIHAVELRVAARLTREGVHTPEDFLRQVEAVVAALDAEYAAASARD